MSSSTALINGSSPRAWLQGRPWALTQINTGRRTEGDRTHITHLFLHPQTGFGEFPVLELKRYEETEQSGLSDTLHISRYGREITLIF